MARSLRLNDFFAHAVRAFIHVLKLLEILAGRQPVNSEANLRNPLYYNVVEGGRKIASV